MSFEGLADAAAVPPSPRRLRFLKERRIHDCISAVTCAAAERARLSRA
jgi:hypothetical protein